MLEKSGVVLLRGEVSDVGTKADEVERVVVMARRIVCWFFIFENSLDVERIKVGCVLFCNAV